MALTLTSTIQQIRSPSMKLSRRSSRGASPSPSLGYPETPTREGIMQKSSSDPELCPATPPSRSSTPNRKRTGLKKLKSIRNRMSGGKSKKGGGEEGNGSESGADHFDRIAMKNAGSVPSASTQAASIGGTPPRPTTSSSKRNAPETIDISSPQQQRDARETITSPPSANEAPTNSGVKSKKQTSGNVGKDSGRRSPSLSQTATRSTMASTTWGSASGGHPMSMPTISPPPPFQFISDDNFTRRVDSYDGQVITCSDSKLPTYEVGNYLGGGVAGVVYEGKRLRPVHEYPPIRVRGGGAFYPNTDIVDGSGGNLAPGSPVAMTMHTSSLSSIRRNRSSDQEPTKAGSATGLFAEVYRAVVPHGRTSSNPQAGGGATTISSRQRSNPQTPQQGRRATTDDTGGCTSFLFGNCGFQDDVDDRATPLSAMPMDNSADANKAGKGKERYQAVDMASIEVPAAFSSMEQETPTNSGKGVHQVVVDDADAPNRSRREARALSRKDASGVEQSQQPRSNEMNHGGRTNDILYHSQDELDSSPNLIEDMGETVAIKILNPVGFRLLEPEALHKAVIVREGTLPMVEPDGSFVLREEHVWWLVNPNSRNLRSLLRKNASSGASSLHTSKSKRDDDSEESSLKRQGSLTQSFSGGVDRGSPERGLRLSLVATYVDPTTNALKELPLPRCVEIWGHPPFAATDEEFEAMMEALLRLNAGGGSGLRRKRSRSKGVEPTRTHSHLSTASNDPLASRRSGSTVFCPALSAYIAVPAIPPKYLRWLKQRRLATKEVRNMMRIGRHRNVVHLYEVLEMVQDSKSTMFLILELVRGGELFDLISSNSSSSKRKKDGASGGNELHEVTMRKFFGELASGINFIHACGVAHRDLKPENLLIHTKPVAKDGNKLFEGICEEEKTLKIADFGLSAAFQLYPTSSGLNISRGDSANSRWDGNSVYGSQPSRQSSGLPLSPQSNIGSSPKSGISPLLNRVGATALSMLTCGSMTNVCIEEGVDSADLVDDGYTGSTVDLRRMTSVVGSPHYVAPEIIAQADKKEEGKDKPEPQDRKARHAARAGYDGTKADVWSAGVILYAMLFRSLPFGEDLLRCPRYQAFQKWYNDARQLQPPLVAKRNRRAFPDSTLDPNYDEFDEEEMLGPHWFFPSEISASGRDLIVAMLNPNPRDRLTIDAVLRHPWLLAMNGMENREYSVPRMSGLCISGA